MNKFFKITLISIFLMCSTSIFANIAVIVHPSNSINLSKEEISRIFLGKQKTFKDGDSAIPIAQSENSEIYTYFNTKVTNKSNSQLKAYWSKLVFTGKGSPPKKVDNNQEVLNLISSNPSLIGYVDSESVTDKVKVVGTF